jgi:hypothetical protein
LINYVVIFFKEFIVKTQYIGWVLLFGLILLTELHVAEVNIIIFVF